MKTVAAVDCVRAVLLSVSVTLIAFTMVTVVMILKTHVHHKLKVRQCYSTYAPNVGFTS